MQACMAFRPCAAALRRQPTTEQYGNPQEHELMLLSLRSMTTLGIKKKRGEPLRINAFMHRVAYLTMEASPVQ
jgi:hypothetical protein